MSIVTWIALGSLFVALYLVSHWFRTYLALRGPRSVTCPETGLPVGVEVNALENAVVAQGERAALKIASCTRWPERSGCGQECLAQVHAAPDGCLIRLRLSAWYEGKQCTRCHRDVSPKEWPCHKPALRAPEGTPMEWADVKPEDIPKVLETHVPICWDCYILSLFVRQYPGRAFVRERPRHDADA